ncbi:hypothetical protein B0H14DRAFT_2657767 [Mycena olivaceomarginata]|nr:hypothetical protein B0H14DRAFT_2657767 [Mycena olivaceomarginata]
MGISTKSASSKGSTEELNVPRILGKNFPIAEGFDSEKTRPPNQRLPLVGERNQLSDVGPEKAEHVWTASPFPSCKLRISTEPSGPSRIGKDVLDDNLDEPGTCRNWVSTQMWGIAVEVCVPPVTEWNEMQLPGVNLLASTEFARPESGRKRDSPPNGSSCQERETNLFCKVPGVLAHYLEVQHDYVLKIIVCFRGRKSKQSAIRSQKFSKLVPSHNWTPRPPRLP